MSFDHPRISHRIIGFVLALICQKLKDADCHENLKEFLRQDVQHAEIINNILQLIHLIKKQSKYSLLSSSEFQRVLFPLLAEFLTKEQLQEYKPLLEHIGSSQNCAGRQLIDRTIAIIEN